MTKETEKRKEPIAQFLLCLFNKWKKKKQNLYDKNPNLSSKFSTQGSELVTLKRSTLILRVADVIFLIIPI